MGKIRLLNDNGCIEVLNGFRVIQADGTVTNESIKKTEYSLEDIKEAIMWYEEILTKEVIHEN